MNQTTWTGPKGTTVTITRGSSKPPRWALLLIDRVVAAESVRRRVGVKWMNCGRGCPHGRAFPFSRKVVLYTSGDRQRDTGLILHELAHLFGGVRHDHGFYVALVRIAAREGKVRTVTQFQNNKAAIRRAKRSLGMLPSVAA